MHLGGRCVNLQNQRDIKIVNQNAWKEGGMMKLKLNFKNFESQLARRAGVINDNSFFEIQMQTQSTQGNFDILNTKKYYL